LCLSQRLAFLLSVSKMLIEDGHQMSRGMVFKFPKRGHDCLRACFDEGIHDVGNSLFSNRAHACVACRKGHEFCFQRKITNLANLEQSVIWSVTFRGKNESRAIR